MLLQSVREKPYPDEERVKGDPARDLATIHHLCEANVIDLQDIARQQVRQYKFITIQYKKVHNFI